MLHNLHDKRVSAVLLADSGSTKTDWCLVVEGRSVFDCQTSGLNPALQSLREIQDTLNGELLAELKKASPLPLALLADKLCVMFYGAGCRSVNAEAMRNALSVSLSLPVGRVSVESDLMAAAHALCRGSEGIACILGTGSNSCLYDGGRIVSNVSPLGYILGDEGSGAVLGKRFVNALFKGGLPDFIVRDFTESTGLDVDAVIRRVYREPMANRFLASLSPFIHSHLGNSEVECIVIQNFIDFFERNISRYHRQDLPVSAVGSVAFFYRRQLLSAASECGYVLGEVLRSPMQGLVAACQDEIG